MNRALSLVRRIVHWLLIVATAAYLLTGLGITQFRIVEPLTFGLLTKNLAFRVHEQLLIPFVVLLVLHICLALFLKDKKIKAD